MLINLSTIDFSGVSGASAKLQEKTTTVLLTDTTTEIVPDEGFDGMAKVIVSHAPVQETVEQTITTNGSHVITPDTGYDAMTRCVVDVNVSGEIDFSSIGYTPEMTKEINDNINSDIAYSEQLLAEYSDAKRYDSNTKLIYAPLFPTQNRTDFNRMFYGCNSLTSIPALDTANGTSFSRMFFACSSLNTISQLNLSNGTKFDYMFQSCGKLINITLNGSINIGIDFGYCTELSYDSIKSILTACSKTTNTNSKTVGFDRTIQDQNNELTNLVSTCTEKGWSVTGLRITQ